jgi:RNA-directed DNA polymerase
VTEGDLPDGVKVGVHAPRGAEEPPGQESEGPYERRSTCNGCGAKGPRKVDGVKAMNSEATPARVPRATQAGDVRTRWAWTEPSVWTDRMRTALEEGVKGGVWFSLIDKVYAERTLKAAWQHVKANRGAAGVDHVTVTMYERDLDRNLAHLATQLRDGTYCPQAIRRTWMDKPGSREQRPLGIPTVRDRIVQTAMRLVLEPILERRFAAQSYGFRPRRGCKDALRRVASLLTGGYTWVVDADLRHYFDTIPQPALLQRLREQVADGRVLALLEAFLTQQVMDGLSTWTPEEGTPQGAVISPMLANIYLNPLDHEVAGAGVEMVRYADDFVLLCRSEADAQRALTLVATWTQAAGLTLHPEKTRIVDATQRGGFDFLGYHFQQGHHWPRAKSVKKLKDTLRAKTRRNNGQSLAVIIADVNRTLRGWFAYFQHSPRHWFRPLDSWLRARLRSILRRRAHRRGRSNRRDHQRWPNAFFAEHGLYNLTTARVHASQSATR